MSDDQGMMNVCDRKFEIATLIGIIALALLLRLPAVNWGMPPANISHFPSLHPDEIGVMKALRQIRPEKLDFTPEAAHIEGTLSYYLWAGLAGIAWVAGVPMNWEGYHRVLLLGRLSTVFLDICSVVLVFFILRRMRIGSALSLLGALMYAIIPFEVMQSVYMRTHVLSNLFILLTIYLSLRIYEAENNRLFMLIGFVLGLGAANRYVFAMVAIIPYCFLLYKLFVINKPEHVDLKTIVAGIFDRRAFIMAAFLIAGLFIGDMPLFLRFDEVKPYLLEQYNYSKMNQGHPGDVVFLHRLGAYFASLIPAGTFLLWIPFYISFIGMIFIKEYRKYFIPITPFFIVYLVLMAKGYPILTIRTVLPLFPYFVLISILAIDAFSNSIRNKQFLQLASTAIMGFVLITSGIYSFACSRAMGDKQTDPFHNLYAYFESIPQIKNKQVVIGFWAEGWWRTVFDDHVESIIKKSIGENARLVHDEKALSGLDYVVLYSYKPTICSIESVIQSIKGTDQKYVVKAFKKDITIGNLKMIYDYHPHDFLYAFPLVVVLEKMGKNR